jgi:hypothetical protein
MQQNRMKISNKRFKENSENSACHLEISHATMRLFDGCKCTPSEIQIYTCDAV